MRTFKHYTAMAVMVALAGCTAQVADPEPQPADDKDPATPQQTPPLRERLASSQSFELLPEAAAVSVAARLPRRDEDYRAELSVERGSASVVREGDRIHLESASVALSDIEVPESVLPPTGLRLTDVRIELASATSGEAVWMEDGAEAYVELEADLLLDWSLLTTSGEVSPLAQQRLEGVVIGLDVHETKTGELAVTLDGEAPGTLWNWSDYAELADLSLALTGTSGEARLH